MADEKAPETAPPTLPLQPTIYEATLGANGAVVKGQPLTQVQAEGLRRVGLDVVVGGPMLSANRSLAYAIERNANGTAKRCPPHKSLGQFVLPHFQPDRRPPEGHTSYETPNRKAF